MNFKKSLVIISILVLLIVAGCGKTTSPQQSGQSVPTATAGDTITDEDLDIPSDLNDGLNSTDHLDSDLDNVTW